MSIYNHEDARNIADKIITKKAQRNPVKAIRAKCIDCCGAEDYTNRIKECDIISCALHPFRMGKNPYREKRVITEEQAEKFRERAKKMWKIRKANLLPKENT